MTIMVRKPTISPAISATHPLVSGRCNSAKNADLLNVLS
ncbi:hypothetical protein HMPREF1566_0019 [Providencia alcalifaciens PAL-1]|nr:hypothetical protein HMPREF1566_0019 [Providencia alcalifaciens PAL-1]